MFSLSRLRKRQKSIPTAMCFCFAKHYPFVKTSFAEPAKMIDEFCQRTGLPLNEIIVKIANSMGLPYALSVEPPTKDLLASTFYDADALRHHLAIPYVCSDSSKGYGLACANPSLVDCEAFTKQGIPIRLASYNTIQYGWATYDRQQQAQLNETLVNALSELAAIAFNRGALEVSLGACAYDSYLFKNAAEQLSGRLSPALISLIEASLTQALEVSFVPKISKIRKVTLKRYRDNCAYPAIMTLESPLLRAAQTLPLTQISKKVLLAEDDINYSLLLTKILQSKGWEVTPVYNGEMAFSEIDKQQFSLVISDVHMPKVDGVALARKLVGKGIDVPILMLTSDEDTTLEAKLALIGVNAVVHKQEAPEVFLAWCNSLTSKKQRGLCINAVAEQSHEKL